MKQTQCERLLRYFLAGAKLTPMNAWNELGISRLAARVHDLRKQGWQVKGEMVSVTNRWGESCRVKGYSL